MPILLISVLFFPPKKKYLSRCYFVPNRLALKCVHFSPGLNLFWRKSRRKHGTDAGVNSVPFFFYSFNLVAVICGFWTCVPLGLPFTSFFLLFLLLLHLPPKLPSSPPPSVRAARLLSLHCSRGVQMLPFLMLISCCFSLHYKRLLRDAENAKRRGIIHKFRPSTTPDPRYLENFCILGKTRTRNFFWICPTF